jgi:hypothetical protein
VECWEFADETKPDAENDVILSNRSCFCAFTSLCSRKIAFRGFLSWAGFLTNMGIEETAIGLSDLIDGCAANSKEESMERFAIRILLEIVLV